MATPGTFRTSTLGGGFTPPPRPIWILLALQLVSLVLDSFAATRPWVELFRLTPLAVLGGRVWQLATYPFVAFGGPSLWFLLSLLMLAWFGGDVYRGLGRKHFWRLLAWAIVGSAVLAYGTFLLSGIAGLPVGNGPTPPFMLMQGQQLLLTLFVAAFATAYRSATLTLFFVLPIQAKWFLGIEILIALILFLQTHDLPGFVGLCAAVGISYLYVSSGGSGKGVRQSGRRFRRFLDEQKLRWRRRRRGMKVVPGGGQGGGFRGEAKKGSWVH
jgi:hypothetical protein